MVPQLNALFVDISASSDNSTSNSTTDSTSTSGSLLIPNFKSAFVNFGSDSLNVDAPTDASSDPSADSISGGAQRFASALFVNPQSEQFVESIPSEQSFARSFDAKPPKSRFEPSRSRSRSRPRSRSRSRSRSRDLPPPPRSRRRGFTYSDDSYESDEFDRQFNRRFGRKYDRQFGGKFNQAFASFDSQFGPSYDRDFKLPRPKQPNIYRKSMKDVDRLNGERRSIIRELSNKVQIRKSVEDRLKGKLKDIFPY